MCMVDSLVSKEKNSTVKITVISSLYSSGVAMRMLQRHQFSLLFFSGLFLVLMSLFASKEFLFLRLRMESFISHIFRNIRKSPSFSSHVYRFSAFTPEVFTFLHHLPLLGVFVSHTCVSGTHPVIYFSFSFF